MKREALSVNIEELNSETLTYLRGVLMWKEMKLGLSQNYLQNDFIRDETFWFFP